MNSYKKYLYNKKFLQDNLAYDPSHEHDACGVAMVATLNKIATHEIVSQALTALRNMESPTAEKLQR